MFESKSIIKRFEIYDGGATRPLPRDGVWRNSTETQQSEHAPRSGPEVKMEEAVLKIACRRLRRGIIKEVSQIPQRASAGAARRTALRFILHRMKYISNY